MGSFLDYRGRGVVGECSQGTGLQLNPLRDFPHLLTVLPKRVFWLSVRKLIMFWGKKARTICVRISITEITLVFKCLNSAVEAGGGGTGRSENCSGLSFGI